MTGRSGPFLILAAIAVIGCFLEGVAGWGSSPGGEKSRLAGEASYYHQGKTEAAGLPDPGCKSDDCHGIYPHERGPEAAFRNLHVSFVECRVCHGTNGSAAWRVDRNPDGRWRLRNESLPGEGDPHRAFGPGVRCRGCHSDTGEDLIEKMGGGALPGTFRNPVALRMLEEGSRKWIPDGM